MATTTCSLLDLTAGDLMSASVMMVPEEMSLQGAAHLLAQCQVSGAPVVNHEGRCIGVLSANDFVRWIDKRRADTPRDHHHGSFCAGWEIVDPGQLPQEAVANYMTRDPVMVAPNTTIALLAKMMIDAHIHRVIVVDHRGRPAGIVSTTDVLAAIVRADQARGLAKETEKPRATQTAGV
jgi:predicted transcriptional regulator